MFSQIHIKLQSRIIISKVTNERNDIFSTFIAGISHLIDFLIFFIIALVFEKFKENYKPIYWNCIKNNDFNFWEEFRFHIHKTKSTSLYQTDIQRHLCLNLKNI